jgi:hypothetical protein
VGQGEEGERYILWSIRVPLCDLNFYLESQPQRVKVEDCSVVLSSQHRKSILHSLLRRQSVVSPRVVGSSTLEGAVAKNAAEARQLGTEPQLLAGTDTVEARSHG